MNPQMQNCWKQQEDPGTGTVESSGWSRQATTHGSSGASVGVGVGVGVMVEVVVVMHVS